jgi:hypothetical protein
LHHTSSSPAQEAELTLNPTGKTGSRCSSPGFGPSLWSRKKVSLAAAIQCDKAKSEKEERSAWDAYWVKSWGLDDERGLAWI